MAKKAEKLRNLTRQELLEKEREVLGFNMTSIIGENKLKIETYVYCNENTFKDLHYDLIKNRCVLFNVNIRSDFVTFDKCKLIENIPFKQGYILSIHLPYGQWSDMFTKFIADELDTTIRRGTVEVYLRKYGLGLYVDPSYELMKRIERIFGVKCSLEIYEDYIWGESNKYLKYMEENGY